MDDFLSKQIVALKTEFMRIYKGNSHIHEIIPLSSSDDFPIDDKSLNMLHKFIANNPIYYNSYELEVLGVPLIVYEGDVNQYWINSIKHDTSYAPFYPMWMLSSFALALVSKNLGVKQIIDVGSGDGRLSYCTQIIDIKSYGIEIDENLVTLQNKISKETRVNFTANLVDATEFDYMSLSLSQPAFFISGLPEVGEMLANSVIKKIKFLQDIKKNAIIVLTGSHSMREYSRDKSQWGWGSVIDNFNLKIIKTITLPTYWTAEQSIDTPFIFAKFSD